jgi:hypothetical protein
MDVSDRIQASTGAHYAHIHRCIHGGRQAMRLWAGVRDTLKEADETYKSSGAWGRTAVLCLPPPFAVQ